MNRRRQRVLSFVFLSVLLFLFCGKAFLSLGVQQLVQNKVGGMLSFEELFIRDGKLVLKKARLIDHPFYAVHAETVSVGLWKHCFEILLDCPHFLLERKMGDSLNRSSLSFNSRFSFLVQNGTFELQSESPICGTISYRDRQAHIEIGEGVCDLMVQSKANCADRLQCRFVDFPIKPFAHFIAPRFLDPVQGTIDGSLHLGQRSLSGHARLSHVQFLSEEWKLFTGAQFIDLDGKILFQEGAMDLQRAKAQLHDGFVQRKGTLLEKIEGRFFANRGIGYRWELQGTDFLWDGKTFYREGCTGWTESTLSYKDSFVSFKMNLEEEGQNGFCSIKKGNPALFHMLCDLGCSLDSAFSLNRGSLNCDFSWKSWQGSLSSWELSSFHGEGLELIWQGGAVLQGSLEGFVSAQSMKRSAIDGSFFLKNAGMRYEHILLNDLQMHAEVDRGAISKASASFHLNGLEGQALPSGSLEEIDLHIDLKGKWTYLLELAGLNASSDTFSEEIKGECKLKGDWDRFLVQLEMTFPQTGSFIGNGCFERSGFSWQMKKGAMQASQCNLLLMPSLFSFNATGLVDMYANYVPDRFEVDCSGKQIRVEQEGIVLLFPEVSSCKISKTQGEWTGSLKKALGEVQYKEEQLFFHTDLIFEKELLVADIHSANGAGLHFSGQLQCALFDKDLPFVFETSSLEGRCEQLSSWIGLDCDGVLEKTHIFVQGSWFEDHSHWYWRSHLHLKEGRIASIQHLQVDLLADSQYGLMECSNLFGELIVQKARIGIRGRMDRYFDDQWRFDFRFEDRFCDLARACGTASQKEDSLFFLLDEKKSHFLGENIQLRDCVYSKNILESMKLSLSLNRKNFHSAQDCLKKIDPCLDAFLEAPIEGSCLFVLDWSSQGSSTLSLRGDALTYLKQPLPLEVHLTQKKERWHLDVFHMGSIKANGWIAQRKTGWKIEEGNLSYGEGLTCQFSGSIGPFFQCECALKELRAHLEHHSFGLQDPLQGTVSGKGYVSIGWKDRLQMEVDLDLYAPTIDWAEFHVENPESIQLHFSTRQGLLMRGLDLHVSRNEEMSSLRARIGLMQYDFEQERCILYHSQLRIPPSFLSHIAEKVYQQTTRPSFLADIDAKQELECSGEISFARDFSSIHCTMKEGLIPFAGEVRHLQNVSLSYNTEQLALDFTTLHQGHGINMAFEVLLEPMSGTIRLSDLEKPLLDEERPMTIRWQKDAQKGVVFHAIDGSFGGIEASFHKEVDNLENVSLIGTAKLNFDSLSNLLPERIAHVFKDLKMGKNYELKGRFYQGVNGLAGASFKGLLSGKNCELFGWDIRSFLSQIEVNASLIRLFAIKGSDPAGILKIDEILMSQALEEPWKIAMSDFRLIEFRPSLLRKIGGKAGPVGPLVVREMKIVDFKGLLEESSSYTAKGDLTFINSFKREHSVFDIPADVLGRIFGLDLELLIPVKGHLTFDLKEGRFWLQELTNAYSEGKRSKFFLLKEDTAPPTIDLDGNIEILVKMKQYVLFKFTENFLLSIGGTLQDPSYSLQKKSRIQKLSR